MATIMYPSLTKSQSMRSKRKSAVELLAESKPFYVKSEVVRDNTQVLPVRPAPNFATGYATYSRSKSVNANQHNTFYYRPTALPALEMAVSPSRSLPPLSHRRSMHLGSGDVLQNKLRQLLVCDSAEELSVEQLGPLSPPAEYAAAAAAQSRCHKSLPDLHHCRTGPEPSSNKSSNKSLSNRDSGGSSGHYTQRSEPPPPPRQETRRDSGSSTQHSGGSSYYYRQEQEFRSRQQQQWQQQQPVVVVVTTTTQQQQLAPPPAALPSAFKRQKCLRYKRDRPILRSKSDISDRYWRPPDHHQQQPPPPAVSHLEQFFDHLGMTSDSYETMMLSGSRSSTSPVFFSDVSTVDSNRPTSAGDNNGGDSNGCCNQAAPFRPTEPTSIVERNARIIKWLCNCRKAQMM